MGTKPGKQQPHPTSLGNHATNNRSNKMSLEQTLEELATSNVTLADSNLALAAAQEKLATAQTAVADKYSEMIAFVAKGGLSAATTTETTTAAATPPAKETAAEKKARIKAEEVAAAAAAAADNDGFGDEDKTEDAPTLTHGDVKAVLLAVKDKFGDKAEAMKLIGKFGYSGIPEIQEKDFKAIYDGANKLLK